MIHDVFVSYADADAEVAAGARCALRAEQVGCWMAPYDVPFGTEFGAPIAEAIRSSRVLLLVLSRHSLNSPYVLREVHLAAKYDIPIFPFRIEECLISGEMEFLITPFHWMKAWNPPVAQHFPSLVDGLRQLLISRRTKARKGVSDNDTAEGGPGISIVRVYENLQVVLEQLSRIALHSPKSADNQSRAAIADVSGSAALWSDARARAKPTLEEAVRNLEEVTKQACAPLAGGNDSVGPIQSIPLPDAIATATIQRDSSSIHQLTAEIIQGCAELQKHLAAIMQCEGSLEEDLD